MCACIWIHVHIWSHIYLMDMQAHIYTYTHMYMCVWSLQSKCDSYKVSWALKLAFAWRSGVYLEYRSFGFRPSRKDQSKQGSCSSPSYGAFTEPHGYMHRRSSPPPAEPQTVHLTMLVDEYKETFLSLILTKDGRRKKINPRYSLQPTKPMQVCGTNSYNKQGPQNPEAEHLISRVIHSW